MKRFTISLLLMLLAVVIYAQNSLPVTISLGGNVPQGISYQAVVRDASNLIVDNEELEVKITLTAELPTGAVAAEYAETHTVTTNANGLFTLTIGQGTSSQQFSDFDWTIQGAIYKITTQTEYGTGTAQLLSVPFALYAAKAGDIDYTNLLAKLSKKDEVAAVLGLAEFIKRQDIGTELSDYAKIAYVEDTLASYALKSDIPAETNLSGYAKTKEVNDTLDFYVLKTAMNSKQDVIEDLDDIRSGAALGATALQSHQDISGKQDVITDLEEIREGAALGATALQEHQDISGKADKADMTITPGTGANADKATIQLKKGTSATVLTAHQSLEGYATISDIPTQVSELENDAEYIKANALSNYYTKKQSDDKYALKTDAYTKAESDERYVKSEKVYTKSEVDALINDKITFLSMEGEIEAKYSVSASKKVAFSKGNLQYNYNTQKFSFAEEQYSLVYKSYANSSTTPKRFNIASNGITDIFWWGTSGWNSGRSKYRPEYIYQNGNVNGNFNVVTTLELYSSNLTDDDGKADWGVYNPITNGENKAGVWRTLTEAEWDYLLNSRARATYKRCLAQIAITSSSSSVKGLLLLPDNWEEASVDDQGTSAKRVKNAVGTTNYAVLGDAQLKDLEKKYGVVFLPSYRGYCEILSKSEFSSSVESPGATFRQGDDKAIYWTATRHGRYTSCSYCVDPLKPNSTDYISREVGGFVRLVRDL